MARHHNFWIELTGKLGVPIFAATTVGCLLSQEFEPIHGVLMLVGVGFEYLNHRLAYHEKSRPQ